MPHAQQLDGLRCHVEQPCLPRQLRPPSAPVHAHALSGEAALACHGSGRVPPWQLRAFPAGVHLFHQFTCFLGLEVLRASPYIYYTTIIN